MGTLAKKARIKLSVEKGFSQVRSTLNYLAQSLTKI